MITAVLHKINTTYNNNKYRYYAEQILYKKTTGKSHFTIHYYYNKTAKAFQQSFFNECPFQVQGQIEMQLVTIDKDQEKTLNDRFPNCSITYIKMSMRCV